jgi:cell division protease FtsH
MTDKKDNEPRGNKNNDRKSPGQSPGKVPKNIYRWVLFFMLGMMLLVMLSDMGQRAEEIDFKEFRLRLENGDVKSVSVANEYLTGELKAEAMTGKEPDALNRFKVILQPGMGKEDWFNELLTENGVQYEFETPNTFYQILVSLLPWIVIFGVMYFFIFRQFRGGGGGMLGNFGRSRHRVTTKDQSKISFNEVAGIEEAKEEVQEIIQFLRSPKKFQRLGGRVPRGILLVGEPGCGKTLLAKAIAGEADVPFFSIAGSDFVEMFVGVGASRVRDLFKQAKDNSPCIIFLDEIDAVGRKRGSGIAGGGNDEREQTLNAILVEMDGFGTNDQVIVIAATNRADVLDHALVRPGRFDRQIYVPLPDVKGRLEILKVHGKKIKLAPKTDLSRIARGTPMYSGADLEAIINEAALSATMLGKESVEMDDLEEARDKVRWGRARRSRVVDEQDRLITAYHEAGHALVQELMEHTDPLHKVSIIPRGGMGGATFSLPEKDRMMYTKNYCLAYIRVCFGGRVAEELFCDDISSGAQGDIKQATEIVKKMVMDWGMNEKLGFVAYGNDEQKSWLSEMGGGHDFSDQTAETIDTEIRTLMNQAYEDVKKLLSENRKAMEDIKESLIKYETLDGEEVKQIIAGKPLTKPTVLDLLEAEKNRTPPSEPKEKAVDPGDDLAGEGFGPMPEPGMG